MNQQRRERGSCGCSFSSFHFPQVLYFWIQLLLCGTAHFAPAFAQIVPRSSAQNLSQLGYNTNTTTLTDFALSQNEQDLFTQLFDRKDIKVSVSEQPKNAILLDSFLLKTSSARNRQQRTDGPGQGIVSRSSDPLRGLLSPNDTDGSDLKSNSTILEPTPDLNVQPRIWTPATGPPTPSPTLLTAPRQAKRRQTARPNDFFLSGDSDGWWSNLDVSSESDPETTAITEPTTTGGNFGPFYDPRFSTNTNLPVSFTTTATSLMVSFSNQPSIDWKTTVSESTRQSSPSTQWTSSTFTTPPIPPPFAVPVPNPSQVGGGFAVMDGQMEPDRFQKVTARQQQSVATSTEKNPVNSFYDNTRDRNEKPVRPQIGNREPPPSPNQGGAPRRQGSVFSAANPVQSQTGGMADGRPGGSRVRYPPTFLSPASGGQNPNSYGAREPPSMSAAESGDDGVKLETCSIGDDSTCSPDGNEVCRRDEGVSTCMCRAAMARRRARESCQGVLRFYMFLRMNRLYDRPLTFGPQFADPKSYPYGALEREVITGIDSVLRASRDFGSLYVGSKLNTFSAFSDDMLANVTIAVLNPPVDTSAFPKRLQESMLDSLGLSERRLGGSNVYVGSVLNAVPGVQDINECLNPDLNDCNASAICTNTMGSFSCACKAGYGDRFASDQWRSGRFCETCEQSYCNLHGTCLLNGVPGGATQKVCQCNGWYIGATCQTDGQVVAVACGSSAVAVILIAVTLVFLLRWSRSSGSHRGGATSTLARSEMSGNTFTYIKGQTLPGTMSNTTSLENKVRLAYLVHPSLLSELPHHQRNQLLDSNFYEVRPPPGRLGPANSHAHALVAAELLNRNQRSGSRDQLASDLNSNNSSSNSTSSSAPDADELTHRQQL